MINELPSFFFLSVLIFVNKLMVEGETSLLTIHNGETCNKETNK